MKKLLVITLSLTMAFCLFGCGPKQGEATNDAQTYTALPLGGGLGDYPLEGPAYGAEYVKIDTPEALQGDGCTVDTYYCADCDTPYIAVFRWKKDDYTLESVTESIAVEFGASKYEVSQAETNGKKVDFGYFQYVSLNEKGFEEPCYYVDCSIFEDGEDFVEIDFFAATEELQLGGDSNQYLWVPKGYDAEENNKFTEEGLLFQGIYDESYYFPKIAIAPFEDNYDNEAAAWAYYFPDGLPFTEAQYNKWIESDWQDGAIEEYYGALGMKLNNEKTFELNGAKLYKYSGDIGDKKVTDGYIYFDDKCFNVWVETELDPAPHYGIGIMSTLHSK